MSKNGAKKGFILDLQTKEGLEHLKNRSSTETANIKSELHASKEGKKILEQKRLKMDYLQREVDAV